VALGHLVAVEEDLLGGVHRAGPAAVDLVVLTLEGARVVPEALEERGGRGVRLLDPPDDLVEESGITELEVTEGEEKVKRADTLKAPLAIERATVKAKEASSKSFVAEPAQPSANMAAARARCNELLERLQVGEPISESDRAWLQTECR
jgi:hypothetical protein